MNKKKNNNQQGLISVVVGLAIALGVVGLSVVAVNLEGGRFDIRQRAGGLHSRRRTSTPRPTETPTPTPTAICINNGGSCGSDSDCCLGNCDLSQGMPGTCRAEPTATPVPTSTPTSTSTPKLTGGSNVACSPGDCSQGYKCTPAGCVIDSFEQSETSDFGSERSCGRADHGEAVCGDLDVCMVCSDGRYRKTGMDDCEGEPCYNMQNYGRIVVTPTPMMGVGNEPIDSQGEDCGYGGHGDFECFSDTECVKCVDGSTMWGVDRRFCQGKGWCGEEGEPPEYEPQLTDWDEEEGVSFISDSETLKFECVSDSDYEVVGEAGSYSCPEDESNCVDFDGGIMCVSNEQMQATGQAYCSDGGGKIGEGETRTRSRQLSSIPGDVETVVEMCVCGSGGCDWQTLTEELNQYSSKTCAGGYLLGELYSIGKACFRCTSEGKESVAGELCESGFSGRGTCGSYLQG